MKGTLDGEPIVDEAGNKQAVGHEIILEKDAEGRPLLGELGEMDGWRAPRVEKMGRTYINETYSKRLVHLHATLPMLIVDYRLILAEWFCRQQASRLPWKQFGADPALFCTLESLPDDIDWTDPSHVGKADTIRALRFWKDRQDTVGEGLVFKRWYHKKEMHDRPESPSSQPLPSASQSTASHNPEVNPETQTDKGKRKAKPLPRRKERVVAAEATSKSSPVATTSASTKQTTKDGSKQSDALPKLNIPQNAPSKISLLAREASRSVTRNTVAESVASAPPTEPPTPSSTPSIQSPATTRPPTPSDDGDDNNELVADLAKLRLQHLNAAPSVVESSASPDSSNELASGAEHWGYLKTLTADAKYLDLVDKWLSAMGNKVRGIVNFLYPC